MFGFRLFLQKNLKRVQMAVLLLIDMLVYYLLPAPKLDLQSQPGKKVILFLGDSLQGRIPRMAKWLQRSGQYECILMVGAGKDFSKFNTEILSRIYTFRSRWQLKRMLKGISGVDLIHAFNIPSYHIAIAIKQTDIPVVMDVQDMYISYFGLNSPMLYMRVDMPHEKYGLEHATGIVSHSVELGNARREYPVAKRPPVLFFPLYCDEDYVTFSEKDWDPEDIHIVYVGAIAGSFQDDRHFGSMKFMRVIDQFSKQRLHLHIYPAPSLRHRDLILEEYQLIADNNPFFHLHDTIPQNELSTTLSGYDFGILPFFLEDTGRSFNKLGRGTSLKLYNYIESGIPVIISEDLAFQRWMAGRYGACIPIQKPDLTRMRELIEAENYPAMKQRLRDGREKIMLGQHIGRLMDFYKRISS